ncbi:MAG: BRO family protein [Nanoarchaeota archaeon]
MIPEDKSLIVFQDKKIRRVWSNDEWWFVLEDIDFVLTDSSDVKQYINKMRQRDEELSKGWVQFVHTLPIPTSGGEQLMNCVSTKGAFRLVQSIPSQKAEPFKLWLAQVGYERVKEIEDPELAQNRVKEYYELKGYPKEWVDKRLKGIAIRQELTDEWKNRGVEEQKDFAILTNEISKATFGKTVGEYKLFKGLKRPNQNLRDHMSDWELILNMVGEKATTDITIAKDAKGLSRLKQTAKEGGNIAKNTRKELEEKIGKSIISKNNYLHLGKKKKEELEFDK